MRIIAGEFRGRRLVAPRGMATRPTTDRVREAWFSMLMHIEGRVADLYAGTGALGFEALSRGATSVVFVETARAAQTAILENAAALGVSDRVELLRLPVEAAANVLERLGPFDLVLTDPPWTDLERAEVTLQELLRKQLLTPSGRIVLGHPKRHTIELPAESGLRLTRTRAWGDSAASFFEAC